MFCQLGCATIGVEERRSIEIRRPIDLPGNASRTIIVRADHDTVAMFEIPLWGALSQEFWIRHNHELSAPTVRILFADDPLDFVASSTGTLDFVTTTV